MKILVVDDSQTVRNSIGAALYHFNKDAEINSIDTCDLDQSLFLWNCEYVALNINSC